MCKLTVHGYIKGFTSIEGEGGRGRSSLQKFLADNAFQHGKMVMKKKKNQDILGSVKGQNHSILVKEVLA